MDQSHQLVDIQISLATLDLADGALVESYTVLFKGDDQVHLAHAFADTGDFESFTEAFAVHSLCDIEAYLNWL